jgi:cephalosporin-C deacetylase-like acetyl esterase
MNKYIFVLPILFLIQITVLVAQVTVKTTKVFPTYEVGETANFQITSTTSGQATYQFVYDDYKNAGSEIPINITAGQTQTVSYTLYSPGAITCKVKMNGATSRGFAMFAPDKITPARAEPADFDAFWTGQKQLLAQVPIAPILTYSKESAASTTYKFSLGNIDNRRVHGWISIPKGNGSYPALLHMPSFGTGIVYPNDFMADQLGTISVSITIHNAEPDQTDPSAYVPNDPANKNTNYYRYAVLAGVRVIDYLQTRGDFNGTEVAVYGESQGGGLSTMIAGIDNRVDVLATGIDALCEHNGWLDGKASSFPYYLQVASYTNNQNTVNATSEAAKYYDAIYFQKRFKGQSYCSISHLDEICPPATVISKINQSSRHTLNIHALELGHNTPSFYYKAVPDFVRANFPTTITPSNNPYASTSKGYRFTLQNNQTATAGIAKYISGAYTIDGQPSNNFSAKWEKISGSGTVTFSSTSALNPSVTFSADDKYIVKVTITDLTRQSDKLIAEYIDYIEFVVGAGGPGGTGGPGGNGGTLCGSSGQQPWEQWIKTVQVGGVTNNSNKEGYVNFSNVQILVPAGSTQTISVTPGYSWLQYNESWRIWADWNQDNDFNDVGELLHETTANTTIQKVFVVPTTAANKQIKLRISMKNGAFPDPCETFVSGEVEDYLLTVTAGSANTCAITATNTQPTCNQNNTPTVASDDTWSFQINVANPGSQNSAYSVSYNGLTAQGVYGTPLSINGIAFANINVTLSITDATNTTCSITKVINAPAPCNTTVSCAITANASNKLCNQNGTPSNANDDIWSVTLNTTSTLGAGSYTVEYNGLSASGAYGTPLLINNLPMNGNNVFFLIEDNQNNSCSTTLDIAPPASCVSSSTNCSISYTPISVTCQQNGTPSNASDDTWILQFKVTNSNTSLSNYFYSVNGQVRQVLYGQDISVSFPMNGNNISLTLADATESTCKETISVSPPQPCYIVPQCQINYSLVSKTCNQNGTATNSSDDTWSLVFQCTNQNTSLSNYQYTVQGATSRAIYTQNVTLSFPMNGATQTINLADVNNPTCTQSIQVTPPAPCVQVCNLAYTEISKVCNQNGTPATASDDTWTLVFRVSNANAPQNGYKYSIGGITYNGSYGQNITRTQAMNNNTLGISITANNAPSCTQVVTVNPPPPCVLNCGINYTEVNKICQQNGTPNISSDDTWLVTLKTTNNNTNLTTFNYTQNGQTLQGTYGNNFTIVRPMNGQTLSISLSDSTNPTTCTRNITVTPPAACATTDPSVYCSVVANAPWEEWIGGLNVNGSWVKYSGKEGYANFTSTLITIPAGTVNLNVLNTYSYLTVPVYTKAWIDVNKNGVFEGSELVLDKTTPAPAAAVGATSNTLGSFNAPSNWFAGSTRMRIIMSTSAISGPCAAVPKGEAEDYNITMAPIAQLQSSDPTVVSAVQSGSKDGILHLFPNPVEHILNIDVAEFHGQNAQIQVVGPDQRIYHSQEYPNVQNDYLEVLVTDYPNGVYFIKITTSQRRPMVAKFVVQNKN